MDHSIGGSVRQLVNRNGFLAQVRNKLIDDTFKLIVTKRSRPGVFEKVGTLCFGQQHQARKQDLVNWSHHKPTHTTQNARHFTVDAADRNLSKKT